VVQSYYFEVNYRSIQLTCNRSEILITQLQCMHILRTHIFVMNTLLIHKCTAPTQKTCQGRGRLLTAIYLSHIHITLVVMGDTRIFNSIPIPILLRSVSADTDTYFDTKMNTNFSFRYRKWVLKLLVSATFDTVCNLNKAISKPKARNVITIFYTWLGAPNLEH
jgi:hypothetical protein